MTSTPEPKVTEPAPADERLAQAHEQIKRADEQLTRLTEQLAKMERDDAQPASAAPVPQEHGSAGPASPGPGLHESGPQITAEPIPSPQPPPGRRTLLTRVGLPLAACIIAAVLFLQSSYGDGAKLVVAGCPAGREASSGGIRLQLVCSDTPARCRQLGDAIFLRLDGSSRDS